MIEAAMPTPSAETPADIETARYSSVEVDWTVTLPPASTSLPTPIHARTSFVITLTATPAPMPAEPVVTPTPPAPLTISVLSVASTETSWPAPPARP
jgi:hypothetical protein